MVHWLKIQTVIVLAISSYHLSALIVVILQRVYMRLNPFLQLRLDLRKLLDSLIAITNLRN